MADNTVYDSAFKTMAHKTPRLMVPLINLVFHRNYPEDALVEQYSNEHEGPGGSTISDSVFKIENKIYHVECQSTAESDMVVRMIEYDFAIALEGALSAGAPYEMDFPSSCVLFLRHTSNTPNVLEMRVNLPNGESFMYQTRVLKAQLVSRDEIFEKRLLVLLPYYLMRYEKSLGNIESDRAKTAELLAECAQLRSGLEAATLAVGDGLLYEQLIELIIRVNDHLLATHEMLRREVKGTMGGEVWELMRERAERLEREAREEGREEGREETVDIMVEQLRDQGVSDDVIAKAVEAVASFTSSPLSE